MSLDVTIWSAKSTSVPGKVHCLKSEHASSGLAAFHNPPVPQFPPRLIKDSRPRIPLSLLRPLCAKSARVTDAPPVLADRLSASLVRVTDDSRVGRVVNQAQSIRVIAGCCRPATRTGHAHLGHLFVVTVLKRCSDAVPRRRFETGDLLA
jgi:hypothetical protein